MKRLLLLLFALGAFAGIHAQTVSGIKEADSAFFAKDYDESIRLCTRMIEEKNPRVFMAYYRRAWCFYCLKRYSEAETDAQVIVTYITKDKGFYAIKSDTYWLLARIYSVLNQKDKALLAYRLALAYREDARLYSSMAFVLIEKEKYKEALKNLNKALKMDTAYAYAYSNRALVYQKMGRLEPAKADIEKSIRLDPTNPYAFKHRALIYLAENKTDLACADLHKARQLGYAHFGDETDANEVHRLLKANCP